jgi:V/A-type H+-transporting ATPase subunit I
MFFPKPMTEVELIVPSKDLLEVTKVLGNRGVFQQIDSTYLGLENLGPNTWQEKATAYSTLERRIQVIMQNLNLEEKYSGPSTGDSISEIEPLQGAVDRIEGEVRSTIDQLANEKKTLEQLESQLSQLEPLAQTNVDVGALRNSNYLHSVLGILPAENVSRLQTSLSRVPHAFFTLREDPKRPVVWVMGPRSNSDVIDRAVKSAYLNPLTLPDEFDGTPAKITETIRKRIDSAKQRISELHQELSKLANAHKNELYDLLWNVHVSRLIADAIARFGQLRHTYVVVGWVPSDDLSSLTQRIKQASNETLIESRKIEPTDHQSNVPVALRNPRSLSPFELLTNTYARPRYEEIDPTALIAITFPLLYGAMFGDVGHGLMLAIFGWFLSRRTKLGSLLVVCGISGMIFGFLYGSIFGFEEVLPHVIKPSESILEILGIAIGVGIVLLNVGILLNLYNAIRARDWPRFFFDSNGLAGWILYLSFVVLFVQAVGTLILSRTIFPSSVIRLALILMVVTTLIAVIFSEPLKHWMEGHRPLVEGSLAVFGVQAFFEMLEKYISMFSNTLSYVRVGAFAIVHAGFTSAVFVIAHLVSGGREAGIGFWTVVVLGNLFVIGLEAFIVFIQTMRLHYYEFFSKFFQGGGSPYEPLALTSAPEK